jgi:hypothetical protein
MSNPNLNPKQFLYHGTVHPFKEGDLVTPQGGHGDSQYAWATPHLEEAHSRAKDWVNYSWEDKKKVNPTWNTPGGKKFDEYAAETPPRVYTVEPIGEVEPAGEHTGEGPVKSRVGFRVIKQVR